MNDILKDIKNVYFVGIGGIGMSALARYFKANRFRVAGYDRVPSLLTDKMAREEGIPVNYRDEDEEIAPEFRSPKDTLVVYTPAVPQDSAQLDFFKKAGFTLHKRAEVLGLLSRNGKAICVAGTHGKTTVSTMTAYLLHRSAVGCNAFLGGISMNFGTNLLINRNSPYIVIEADEFDRSFLHLYPEMAVITSMDNDHMDIYENRENLLQAFNQFASQVRPDGGKLFLKQGLSLESAKVSGYYAVDTVTDCYSDHLRVIDGHYLFDYHGKAEMQGLILGVPGRVNVENATAAITLALEAGATPEEIREALPEFRGVVRRFNIHAQSDGKMYIDDYAHHPKEIEATLKSVREMWPQKQITVVFQPHLYTRTRDFYPEFAKSLSLADRVILLDIYPARELPIPGVTSGLIRDEVTVPAEIMSKEALLEYIGTQFEEGIIMTVGAGDIDRMIPAITQKLLQQS